VAGTAASIAWTEPEVQRSLDRGDGGSASVRLVYLGRLYIWVYLGRKRKRKFSLLWYIWATICIVLDQNIAKIKSSI